ncbi:MAG TPA: YkgJ family cysteine cluster protein [Terriglobales bacterium]|nr:YkgJ family cysteine cluster protein [Terriglobales bacterium]
MPCHEAPARDQELIQIVNAALADAFQKSSKWLACKPGCSQCCHGVFAINQLDAIRLRKGLAELEAHDPERAGRLRKRALDTVARLSEDYPGDPVSGLLDKDDTDEAAKRWDDFGNAEPCPALDPSTGRCELYEYRPVLCRTFGPAMKSEGDLGHCELCFVGATEEEVIAAEMTPDPDNLEAAVLDELQKTTGASGETIVAFALVRE